MVMKPKSNDLEAAPEHQFEQQTRKAAKAALKKRIDSGGWPKKRRARIIENTT
jgi:hypothetical protein